MIVTMRREVREAWWPLRTRLCNGDRLSTANSSDCLQCIVVLRNSLDILCNYSLNCMTTLLGLKKSAIIDFYKQLRHTQQRKGHLLSVSHLPSTGVWFVSANPRHEEGWDHWTNSEAHLNTFLTTVMWKGSVLFFVTKEQYYIQLNL